VIGAGLLEDETMMLFGNRSKPPAFPPVLKPLRAWTGLVVLLAWSSGAFGASSETWRSLFYGELKVGYVHTTSSREKREGESLHRTDVEQVLSYFQGKDIRFSSLETYLEREDGSLVEFSYSSTSSSGKTSIRGTVKGDKVYYILSYPKKAPKEMTIDWLTDTLGPRGVETLMKSKGLSPETSYAFKMYSFTRTTTVSVTVTVQGREKVSVGGKERDLHRLSIAGEDIRGGDGKPIPRKRWVDGQGRFVKEWDMRGGGQTQTACSKDEALAAGRGLLTQYNLRNRCAVDEDVMRPRLVTQAGFLLKGPSGLFKIKYKGPGQAGRRRDDGMQVTVRVPKAPSGGAMPCKDEAMAPFLKANYFLDFDQGEVKAVARRVVGGGRNARKAAEALRVWTFQNLRKNPINMGIATASSAIAHGEGDALEHAVVLAGLCRAVGIPSRLVGGLLISSKVAHSHVWTEVWAGGWMPLDATQEDPIDAMRIRFAESDLNEHCPDAVLVDLSTLMTSQQGPPSVELMPYKLKGVTVTPGKSVKGVHRMKGNQYFHSLLGFGFSKPEAFRFNENLRGIDAGIIAIQGKRGDRILFRSGSMEYHQTLEDILQSMEANFTLSAPQEIKVGGQRGLVVKMRLKGRPGFCPKACYVRFKGTVFIIESTDTSASAESAYQAVLKSTAFKD
jgi:hypothetical protein